MTYNRGLVVFFAVVLLSIAVPSWVGAQELESFGAPRDYAFSLPRETGFVGTNLLETVQKYNTVGADGDLRVSIPLYEVPGKMPVPITLDYKSGIKLDQNASWVGLGWNLGGWSVKRVTVNGDDINSFTYYDRENQSRYFVNDVYQVDIPGRSVQFFNTGTMEQPHFVPMQHSSDSLYVDVEPERILVCDSCPMVWKENRWGTETWFRVCDNEEGEVTYPTIWQPHWEYSRYNYFVFVDENATRYVFKFALKRSATGGPVEDFYRHPSGDDFRTTCNIAHDSSLVDNSEWLLTAILSHDYVDGGSDPLDPLDSPQPKYDNAGSWVSFVYTGYERQLYRDPDLLEYTKRSRLMGRWVNSETMADQPRGGDWTEIAYLRKIITPEVVIDFTVQSLKDKYHNVRWWRSGIGCTGGSLCTREKDLVLVKMRVFEYCGDSTLPVGVYPDPDPDPPYPEWFLPDFDVRGQELMAATFNYEYPDSVMLKTMWHNYFWGEDGGFAKGSSDPHRDGEATLHSVVIGTDNRTKGAFYNSAVYEAAEYAPHGYKKRYSFTYDAKLEDPDPQLGLLRQDRWASHTNPSQETLHRFSNYSSWVMGEDLPHPFSILNRLSSWNNGDLENQDWVENTAWLITKAWTFRDFFGYNCEHPQAWSMVRMTTPEGVTFGYDYESDEFKINTNHWVSGGCRVKRIIVNAPADTTMQQAVCDPPPPCGLVPGPLGLYPFRDSNQADTIEFTYGDQDDGIGYATSMPANYEIFRKEYSIESMTPWQFYKSIGIYLRFLGDNVDHVIQYPRITWHMPHDRGTAQYYYSTTNTVPSDRLDMMKFMSHPAVYSDGLLVKKPFDWYDAFWLNRSPLHGVPYKTVLRDGSGNEVYYNEKSYTWPIMAASLLPAVDGFETSRFTFTSSRFSCDTVAISYHLRLNSEIERKDGVETTTQYTYENSPLARLSSVSKTVNGSQRITEYEYAATGIPAQANEYDNRHYLALKTKVTEREVPGDKRSEKIFTYKDDFASQNRSDEEEIYYLRETKDWLNNLSAPNDYLVTEVLDVDRLGNPISLELPDGTKSGAVYSHRGLEASFANVAGDNWAYFSEDVNVPIYDQQNPPPRVHLHSSGSIVGSEAPAFTGQHSCLIPATNSTPVEGIGAYLASPPAGLYMAECWAMTTCSTGTAKLYITSGTTVTVETTTYNDWQHLVCSLTVSQGGSVSVGTQATQCNAYFDDLRVYPAGCLVNSFTYDPLLRKTTASGPTNTPSRAFYNQYGDMSAVADYQYSPVQGREWFYKSTEPIGRVWIDMCLTAPDQHELSRLRYQSDMPNATYTINGRGKGVVDDFSVSRLHRYEVDNTLFLENGRLWFEAQNSDAFDKHGDLIIPVDPFADGFLEFDVLDSFLISDACSLYQTGGDEHYSHLWYGFETSGGAGYAVCINHLGNFVVFKYSSVVDYEQLSHTVLLDQDMKVLYDGNCHESCEPYFATNLKGKQRLGLARFGNDLYFFINNDCVYRLTDNSFSQFSKVRLRFRRSGVETCKLRTSLDNLVLYSDPAITTDFINSFGMVKQTQVYDGSRIAVSGATNTLDFKKECEFKPVMLDPSPSYGCFAWTNDEISPFDFIDRYLVSAEMYTWNPGEVLDASSYVVTYHTDTVGTPNTDDDGLQVPYSLTEYENGPLRRPQAVHPAGAFRNHPLYAGYGNTDDQIDGYSSQSYAADSVLQEITVDENDHALYVYKDKLDRVINSSRSIAPEDFECTGGTEEVSVNIHCTGSGTGHKHYIWKEVVLPPHLEGDQPRLQAVSQFYAAVESERCNADRYTKVYVNNQLVFTRTNTTQGQCDLGPYKTFFDNIDAQPGDIVHMVAYYPENLQVTGSVDLTLKYDVCSNPGSSSMTPLATTLFYNDFFGNDTLVVQPEGQNIRREYNNLGWLVKDSAGDYGRSRNLYDKAGNLRLIMSATDSVANRFRYIKYDGLNRPIEDGVISGDRSLFSWSNAFTSAFPDGSVAGVKKTGEYVYDQGTYGRGLLTKATRWPSGSPDSASWEEYVYDAYGLVATKKQHVNLIDAGTTTRDIQLTYNNLGQTTQITHPNTLSVAYQYDRAGRVKQVSDPGNPGSTLFRAEFVYWPTGQVKTKTLGRLSTNPTTPAQTVDYKYNARDWLVSINDGAPCTTSTGNADHFRLALSYTADGYLGHFNQFLPGAYYNGNIAKYKAWVSDYVTGGVRTTEQSFAYDALDRLVGESFAGTNPPAPQQRLYGYDRNGNMQHMALDLQTYIPAFEYYYYPGTNRLMTSSLSSDPLEFYYTPSGSIENYSSDFGKGMGLGYNCQEELARRVMQGEVYQDTVRYWYNTSGQRIAKKFNYVVEQYCWQPGDSTGIESLMGMNSLMMPFGDSLSDTGQMLLYYDSLADTSITQLWGDSLGGGLGMMQMMQQPPDTGAGYWYPCPRKDSATTGYYYLGDDLLFDYRKTGTSSVLIGNYVYANGERIAKFEDANLSNVDYYLTDHLGSVVAQVNCTGAVQVRNLYKPWGERLASSVASGHENQFQYTSQYVDEDLNRDLSYFGKRYYDGGLKIFTSVDPMWYKYPSWGSYVYCMNNPMALIDVQGDLARPAADKYSAYTTTYIDMARSGKLGEYAQYQMASIDALSYDVYYGGGDVSDADGKTALGNTGWSSGEHGEITKINITLDIADIDRTGGTVPSTAVHEGHHALNIEAVVGKRDASIPMSLQEKKESEDNAKQAQKDFRKSFHGDLKYNRKMQEYRRTVRNKEKDKEQVGSD